MSTLILLIFPLQRPGRSPHFTSKKFEAPRRCHRKDSMTNSLWRYVPVVTQASRRKLRLTSFCAEKQWEMTFTLLVLFWFPVPEKVPSLVKYCEKVTVWLESIQFFCWLVPTYFVWCDLNFHASFDISTHAISLAIGVGVSVAAMAGTPKWNDTC